MRMLMLLPLLVTAACDVDSDSQNEQVTLEYDRKRIKEAAAGAARTAREVGSGVGNVAVSTGRAIKKEGGEVDVDIDVTRNRQNSAGDRNVPVKDAGERR